MLAVNPQLSVDQLIDGLQRSARPHVHVPRMPVCSAQSPGRCQCDTATCGAGILDAPQALAYALAPSSYVAPARTAEVIDNDDVRVAVATGADQPPLREAGATTSTPDSGGGALNIAWLAALAAAVAALARRRRG